MHIVILDAKDGQRGIDAASLIAATAAKHQITMRAMLGQGRSPILVNARADAAIQLRRRGWTYQGIGELFGKHHTTVMNWVQTA